MKARGPYWALALAVAVALAASALVVLRGGGGVTDEGGSGAAVSRPELPLTIHDRPRPVEDVTFEGPAGAQHGLSDFRGQVVVLNLWATWCPPCREEMPTLDALQQRLGGDGFQVIALSVDQGGMSVVREFYDEIGIEHLPRYIDSSMRVMSGLGVRGLPTTLVLDRQGREVGRLVGKADWATPQVIDFLNGLMARGSESE